MKFIIICSASCIIILSHCSIVANKKPIVCQEINSEYFKSNFNIEDSVNALYKKSSIEEIRTTKNKHTGNIDTIKIGRINSTTITFLRTSESLFIKEASLSDIGLKFNDYFTIGDSIEFNDYKYCDTIKILEEDSEAYILLYISSSRIQKIYLNNRLD